MKNRIRYLRRMKDITQIELSRKIGCSHSWIYMIEKNYYQPDENMVKRIAEVLDVSEEELFNNN